MAAWLGSNLEGVGNVDHRPEFRCQVIDVEVSVLDFDVCVLAGNGGVGQSDANTLLPPHLDFAADDVHTLHLVRVPADQLQHQVGGLGQLDQRVLDLVDREII